MTKKEIEKKFKFSGKDGKCSDCEYVDHCDKILPGFNKPGKCAGPFHKDDEKKDKKKVVKINESDLRRMISEAIENTLGNENQTIDPEVAEVDAFNRYWEEFEDWMDSYSQADYPTSYSMRDVAWHFYQLGKKGETLNEGGGYDMNTPEGRRGAEDWMHYVISQGDPAENAAMEWAQENGLDGDENIIRAFTAGVEYGRNC